HPEGAAGLARRPVRDTQPAADAQRRLAARARSHRTGARPRRGRISLLPPAVVRHLDADGSAPARAPKADGAIPVLRRVRDQIAQDLRHTPRVRYGPGVTLRPVDDRAPTAP